MDAAAQLDHERIVRIVQAWTPEQRVALIQDVLKTLVASSSDARERRPTLQQARGLLAGTRPPPSDADVERWRDERRTERYGA